VLLESENDFQFFIRDNGVGIAEAYHDKIFKVFTRIDSNNKSSGIGLSIVKKIIDFIKEEFGWRVRKKRDYILQYLKLMEEANLNYIDELSGDDLDF
jgi:K+-sensing histidine kinase KdpD